MFKIILLLISISCVYSPIKPIIYFPRIICYESFSKPKLYLPLHIHSYTGPEFIKAHFNLEIKYSESSKYEEYLYNFIYFKKTDGFCDYSNITFSTNGINYYELLIYIEILLPNELKTLSITAYIFEKGFRSDKYTLVDEYGNFAITVKITDFNEGSLKEVVSNEDEAHMYLRTLKYEGNHICFVTVFNRRDAIKPIFSKENKEKGYIIGITAQVMENGISQVYEYAAFECLVPEEYNKPTYFIFEGDHEPNFFATTVHVNEENQLTIQKESFSTPNSSNNLMKMIISRNNLNLVFLVKDIIIKCDDSTKRKAYTSKHNFFLYVHYRFNLHVKQNIRGYQWIIYDPLNPCEK